MAASVTKAQPEGVLLMSGRRLNSLLTVVRARTPLNAGLISAAGWAGVREAGGSRPPAMPGGRYEDKRAYLVSKALMRRVAAALAARSPQAATQSGPRGFGITSPLAGQISRPATAAIHSTQHGLAQARQAAAKITPLAPSYSGRDGYRLVIPPRKAAVLEIETQLTLGYSRVCLESNADPVEDGYSTEKTVTSTFANGSYTQTWTASGVIQGYGPGGTPDACAELSYSDTIDPEFEYGAFVDEASSHVIVPWTSAISAAEAAVEDWGDPGVATYEWPADSWRAVSHEGVSSIHYLGLSDSNLILPESNGWRVQGYRFRMRNTGGAALRVDYRFIKSPSSTEVAASRVLRRGERSDWIKPPACSPWDFWDGIIERVRIARFVNAS